MTQRISRQKTDAEPKRAKPMRRVSNKRAKLMREVGPQRLALIEEIGRCQNQEPYLGDHVGELTVHEITNGPNRERALGVRAAQLVLCVGCNCGEFTDNEKWPLERQLALKLIVDAKHFDLDAINKLLAPEGSKNPPQAVTLADVVDHLTLYGT